MAWNLWPYTNLHNTNLDWVIGQIKMIKDALTRALQAAEQAETAADTATEKASDASDFARNSSLSAQNAAQSASNAALSAGEAQNYAEHISDPVSGLVTTWLQDNITQETGYVIDESLTVAGAAADAKATGGGLQKLNAELSPIPIVSYATPYRIVRNSQVTSTTGVISESTTHSRTDYVDLMGCTSVTFNITGTIINCCFYDETETYISGSATITDGSNINRPVRAKYIIVTCTIGAIDSLILTLNNANTVISNVYEAIEAVDFDSVKYISDFSEKYLPGILPLQNVHGAVKFPGNIVDISECINNCYIFVQTGNLSNEDNNYFCTGYLPVIAETTYKSNKGRNWAWYDADKSYISGTLGIGIQNGITAPANAAYIRFSINKTTDRIDSPADLYFTDTDSYDTAVTIPGLIIQSNQVHPWCYGMTINWIGDSIVDGPDFDEKVCTALGLTKLTVDGVDGGINGSTIAVKADGTTGRNPICLRYSDMPNNADIIAVSAGTNDWMYAWCPVGDINSTATNTFYGALKTLCEGLINMYPDKLIFFTTPIKRAQAFESGNGGEFTPDGVMTTPFSKNKYGYTLMDYADIIKEVCGYYSIPVLDLNRESLLNPNLTSQASMFDSVGTHPNNAGQKIMARRVTGWLKQLGSIIE